MSTTTCCARTSRWRPPPIRNAGRSTRAALAERLRSLEVRRETLAAERQRTIEITRQAEQLTLMSRRRRQLVAGSAVLSVVLAMSVWQQHRTGQAREEAERSAARAAAEAAKTRQVVSFLTDDVLKQADPYSSNSDALTLREAIDNAARDVDTPFPRRAGCRRGHPRHPGRRVRRHERLRQGGAALPQAARRTARGHARGQGRRRQHPRRAMHRVALAGRPEAGHSRLRAGPRRLHRRRPRTGPPGSLPGVGRHPPGPLLRRPGAARPAHGTHPPLGRRRPVRLRAGVRGDRLFPHGRVREGRARVCRSARRRDAASPAATACSWAGPWPTTARPC